MPLRCSPTPGPSEARSRNLATCRCPAGARPNRRGTDAPRRDRRAGFSKPRRWRRRPSGACVLIGTIRLGVVVVVEHRQAPPRLDVFGCGLDRARRRYERRPGHQRGKMGYPHLFATKPAWRFCPRRPRLRDARAAGRPKFSRDPRRAGGDGRTARGGSRCGARAARGANTSDILRHGVDEDALDKR